MNTKFASAASIFMPDANDWLVTLNLHSGRVVSRRVSPGSIDREHALRCALLAESVKPQEVSGADVRRFGNGKVEAVDAGDPFAALVERLRLR